MTRSSTWNQIASTVLLIGRATDGLPLIKVVSGQRQGLAGRLFPEGPLFVERVADALLGKPELYPDSPVSGEELREHQMAAGGLLLLRGRLTALIDRVNDSYLFHQSEGIRKSCLVTDQVQGAARLPGHTGLRHLDRLLHLLPALVVFHGYQWGRVHGRAAHGKGAEAAAGPLEQPPAGQGGQGQNQPPAKDKGRERRRAAMFRLFDVWRGRRLRELGQPDPLKGACGRFLLARHKTLV